MNFFLNRRKALEFRFWSQNLHRRHLWDISVVVSPAARQLWLDFNQEVLDRLAGRLPGQPPQWYHAMSNRIP